MRTSAHRFLYQVMPSPLHLFIVLFLFCMVVVYFSVTHNQDIVLFAIPVLLLLIVIPMGLRLLTQREYVSLLPLYETESKTIRAKAVERAQPGDLIRIYGTVESIRFSLLNRPNFIISDRTGSVIVKMAIPPPEKIHHGDRVEALGQVIRRYIVAGEPVINGIMVRKHL